MTTHEPGFVGSLSELAKVVKRYDLPTPIGLTWHAASSLGPALLEVQIVQANFAAWMRLLPDPDTTTTKHDQHTHVRVTGVVRKHPLRIALVCVMHGFGEQIA